MVEEETIENLISYFKKLKKILIFESDFSFFSYKLIKKSKIDDILCCILATLPNSYKQMMKQKEGKKYTSVLAYNLLFNSIKNKFILNPDVYLISYNNADKYIGSILTTLKKDITAIEKNAS